MKNLITTKSVRFITIIVSIFVLLAGVLFMGNVKTASAVSFMAVSPTDEVDSSIWKKTQGTITVSKTTNETQFYLASDNNLRDEYTLEASFCAENKEITQSIKEYGIVPFYTDAYNYIVVSLRWSTALNSNGLGAVVIDGLIEDKELNFHTSDGISSIFGTKVISMNNSTFSNVLPNEELILKVEKKVNYSYKCYDLDISIKRAKDSVFTHVYTAVVTNLITKYGSGLSKAGVYAYNDAYTIKDLDFDTYTYVSGTNQTIGDYTCMNSVGNVWAYNEDTETLKLNGHEGTAWCQTFALKEGNCGTSYYVGARMTPEYSDSLNYWTNPSDSAYGSAEFVCGLIPYYGDENNRLMVFFSEWTTTSTVNIVVENYINGQASGQEFRSTSISPKLFGLEKYLEVGIVGDEVLVYVNRSVLPTFSTTVDGLSNAMQTVSPKYGAMGVSCSARYDEIIQSTTRTYKSVEKASVTLKSYTEVSKVNGVCHIDAEASNSTNESCYLEVACYNPSNQKIDVVNNMFIPTIIGNYKLVLTAYDSFSTKGEVVELTVRVVSEDTKIYIIQYKATNCTGSMREQYAVCGEDVTLLDNNYKYVNQSFLGWGVKAGATEKVFDNKQIISGGLSSNDGAVVTLYAVFGEKTEENKEDKKSGGCGSNAEINSISAGVLGLGSMALVTKKLFNKKEEKQ